MIVYVKYIILVLGIIAGIQTLHSQNIGAGITLAGAFIAFALIEIQDIKNHKFIRLKSFGAK